MITAFTILYIIVVLVVAGFLLHEKCSWWELVLGSIFWLPLAFVMLGAMIHTAFK